MKSEYGDIRGRIDAYIVSSGEFFWGGAPQSIASQRASLVLPIDTDTAVDRLATRPPAPEDAGTVERVKAALAACADALESELQGRYPVEAEGNSPYPDMHRRYTRDMADVIEARAALAALSRLDGEKEA